MGWRIWHYNQGSIHDPSVFFQAQGCHGICHPGTVTTTMTTTFAHQESSSWKVTGPCSVLGDCVQSGNYPEDYGDSDWRLNIFDVNFRASQGFTDFVSFHFVTWAITPWLFHMCSLKPCKPLRWEMCNQDATALSDQLHHFFHRSFLWCSDGEWCWIFRYFKCRYCCSGLGQHHMVIRFKCIFWCLGIVLCEAYMLWWFAANSSGCIWLPPWNHATSELQRCLTRRALWGWWHLWYTNWHQQLLLVLIEDVCLKWVVMFDCFVKLFQHSSGMCILLLDLWSIYCKGSSPCCLTTYQIVVGQIIDMHFNENTCLRAKETS